MNKWIDVCDCDEIEEEDVIRFDHNDQTFAIYKSDIGEFFATDGLCTHEKVHLCDGLVMDDIIECPKHNGQFKYKTGEAVRLPACENLKTYPTRSLNGRVQIQLSE